MSVIMNRDISTILQEQIWEQIIHLPELIRVHVSSEYEASDTYIKHKMQTKSLTILLLKKIVD